jgi:hypothetical protein
MNLRDYAIGNIEKIMWDFVNEKMSDRKKREIGAYMKVIASNAFRLGFGAGYGNNITEEEFFNLRYVENKPTALEEKMTELLFRINV